MVQIWTRGSVTMMATKGAALAVGLREEMRKGSSVAVTVRVRRPQAGATGLVWRRPLTRLRDKTTVRRRGSGEIGRSHQSRRSELGSNEVWTTKLVCDLGR